MSETQERNTSNVTRFNKISQDCHQASYSDIVSIRNRFSIAFQSVFHCYLFYCVYCW